MAHLQIGPCKMVVKYVQEKWMKKSRRHRARDGDPWLAHEVDHTTTASQTDERYVQVEEQLVLMSSRDRIGGCIVRALERKRHA